MTCCNTRGIFLILIFAFSVTCSVLSQEEKILHYDVQIEVNVDRSILVTEYIEVNVRGEKIQRGITRFLPTSRNRMT